VALTLARTRRVAETARRRRAASLLIDAIGAALATGSGVGLTAVLIARALPIARLDARWPWLIAGPVALAALVLGALALARRWTLLRSAREVDRRLDLRDRLGTAIELADRPAPGVEPAFVELAAMDAERVAGGVAPERAVPLRLRRVWPTGGALALAALAAGLWMPSLDLLARQARAREQARRSIQVRESIADASAAARAALAEHARVADAATELQAIEQIERELAAGRTTPEQARVESARQLQELAARVERTAQEQKDRQQALKDALARAGPSAPASEEPLSQVAQAIRDGDLGTAAQAAEHLARDLPRMPAEQRRQVAEELRRLSEALEAQRRGEPGAEPEPTGAVTPGEPPAPERGADDPPMPPESDVDRIREALDDAARQLEQPPAPPPDIAPPEPRGAPKPGPKAQPRDDPQRQPAPGEPDRPDAAPKPGKPADQPDQGQPKPGERPGEQPRASEPRASPPAEGAKDSPPPSPPKTTGQPRPGAEQPRPGAEEPAPAQPGAEPRPAGEPRPGERQPSPVGQREPSSDRPAPPQPGQAQPGARPEPSPAGDQRPQPAPGPKPPDQPPPKQPGQAEVPRPEPGAAPDQPPPPIDAPGEGPTPDRIDGQAIERLAEELRRLENMDGSARRRLAESKALREQAERMLRQMSPRDRQQLEELARRWGGDPSGLDPPRPETPPPSEWSGPIEAVDARPRGTPASGARESVISEWLAPPAPDRDATARREATAERFREAARGAERAVEQQGVPMQHRDLVRRVFNRYTERATGGQEPR